MRAVLQNWDNRVPTELESGFSSKIGTIPPNSERLDTLQGIFGGPGTCSHGKIEISGFETAGNALKLSILPSPHYFSIILNLLRSHQADLFGSWGGGACTPPPPPALPTGLLTLTEC